MENKAQFDLELELDFEWTHKADWIIMKSWANTSTKAEAKSKENKNDGKMWKWEKNIQELTRLADTRY